jgi:hypothetical protein
MMKGMVCADNRKFASSPSPHPTVKAAIHGRLYAYKDYAIYEELLKKMND